MFEFGLENEFDFASAEYRALFDASGASAFQHPLWLEALYRRLAPAVSAEPLVLTARRGADGGLAMLLPLARLRRRGLRVVEFADLGVSDYAAPVCAPQDLQRLLQTPRAAEQIGARLKPYDILRLKKLRDGALPLEDLFPGGRRARMDVSAHATALFAPFDAWRAAKIPGAWGKELARNRRYMERLGDFRFELLSDPGEIEDLLLAMQVYRGRRYPGDLLGDPAHFDFYRAVALAGGPTGFARAYRVSLNGATLGGTLGLSWRGRFVGLILGCDLETYRSRSLGALTIEAVARACIAEHHAVLDFSVGDENYKRLFSAEPTPLWIVTGRGTLQGAIAEHIKARISPRAPASPTPAAARPAGVRA